MEIVIDLKMIILLVNALNKMSGYAKYMNEFGINEKEDRLLRNCTTANM